MALPFTADMSPVTVKLALSGLAVRATVVAGTRAQLSALLSYADVDFEADSFTDAIFTVAQLRRVTELEPVTALPDRALAPVWEVLAHPPMAASPAAVSADRSDRLWLSWLDGDGDAHDHVVPAGIGKVLMVAQVPFSASPRAWDLMSATGSLPIIVGRARMNMDRFIDISSAIPQATESAPVRGLFRQTGTLFGCAAAFAGDVSEAPGFIWSGPLPRRPEVPVFTNLLAEVSAQRWADISTIVSTLAIHGAAVVRGGKGAGRRFTTLAAATASDALPVVVVCSPPRLWVWSRHADRLGLSWTVGGVGFADVHIITYADLAGGISCPDPAAVIFDALDEFARGGGDPAALRGFDHLIDTPKIAVCESWPERLGAQTDLMSVVRPREFVAGADVGATYCGDAAANARTHIGIYQVEMTSGPDPEAAGSDKVVVVALDDKLTLTLDNEKGLAAERSDERQEEVERDIVDVGSATSMSPKLVAAAQLAKAHSEAGASVAVVVRNARAQTIVKALCRPARFSPAAEPGKVTVRLDWADVSAFDTVVATAWPDSFSGLAACLRADGTQDVVVVSADVDVDDDRAIGAALADVL